MFRHQGKRRTAKHNLQIATILSFVAGTVNVTGFLSLERLTTNVTGHFAFFIHDVTILEFWPGTIYLLYLLSFLSGSFVSSLLVEQVTRKHRLNIFLVPTLLEAFILVSIPILVSVGALNSNDLIACCLLFAMGLQNSLVTRISNAVVRTTHVTGLFTDLGIELSQLCFPQESDQRVMLWAKVKLRLYIICFFFLGGVFGGVMHSSLQFKTLFIAAAILLLGLLYDNLRYRLILLRRKYVFKQA